MKLDRDFLLRRTRWRDRFVLAVYALLLVTFFQFATFSDMPWDTARFSMCVVMTGQFYLTAFLRFPVNRRAWRWLMAFLFHVVNYLVFREVIVALSPVIVVRQDFFEIEVAIFFALVVLGRDIHMYTTLAAQLSSLERWSEKKILFSKPDKIEIHLGEAGKQEIHPNEIVYIRTRSAGDHTKVFGIKSRIDHTFREYETAAYQSFEEIGKVLHAFPQFKRISRSTVINHKYPFVDQGGVITIEGRKFTRSYKLS